MIRKLTLVPVFLLFLFVFLLSSQNAAAQGTYQCIWNTQAGLPHCKTRGVVPWEDQCNTGYRSGEDCAAINDPSICNSNSTEFECVEGGGSNVICPDGVSIDTAIGCIPIENTNEFIGFILRWAIGIGGGIAFLLIIFAGFQIMTSAGNPERLQAGRELLTSAIAGLILLVFSVFILRIIGVDMLNLPGFGG